MAFAPTTTPPSASFADSLHQILYLLNSPTTCLCKRNVCVCAVREPTTTTSTTVPPAAAAAVTFCLHFGFRRQERERQRKVNRWTAAVTGLPYRAVQPAGSLISLPPFSFQDLSFPPHSAAMCQWGFCLEYWNSLCLVLFVRLSVRIPPPTHSWLRNVLRLPSQVSTHFITSLPCARSLFYFSSSPFTSFSPPTSSLPTSLHILSLPLIASLSVCLLVLSGVAVGEGAASGGDESVGAKAHKLLAANTKELLWR